MGRLNEKVETIDFDDIEKEEPSIGLIFTTKVIVSNSHVTSVSLSLLSLFFFLPKLDSPLLLYFTNLVVVQKKKHLWMLIIFLVLHQLSRKFIVWLCPWNLVVKQMILRLNMSFRNIGKVEKVLHYTFS